MRRPVVVHPIPQRLLMQTQLTGNRRHRARQLHHTLRRFILKLRSKRPPLPRQWHPLFRTRTLVGSLSGRSGAPQPVLMGGGGGGSLRWWVVRPGTVRGWLSRFAGHAEPIRVGFAQVEQWVNAGGDLDRVAPAGSPVADAVAQIGAAVAAVRRGLGGAVFAVSVAQVVVACSGLVVCGRNRRCWVGCGSTRPRLCE